MNEQKKKQLLRIAKVVDQGSIAIVEYIQELEDKINNDLEVIKQDVSKPKLPPELLAKIKSIKGEDGKTPTKDELLAIIEPLIPQIEQPEDGQDYVLTEQDKIDIASSIKVPIIKQIVEKTEVIKEQPIVTNNTIEKITENPFTLYGEEIVKKINSLDTYPDNQIDAKHIKNLPKQVNSGMAGGTNGIIQIVAGSNITVDNSNPKYPIVSSTGGGGGSGFQSPLSGTVDGSNTIFTWTTAPKALVVDGSVIQKTQQDTTVNWTGTTTTTLSIAPNFSLFAIA